METITPMGAYVYHFFVFPGLLFLAIAGMLVSWVDRKVTARIQWRAGPPLLQPLYDIMKLFVKETVVPAGGNTLVFAGAPLVSLLAIVLISNILILTWTNPAAGFVGDMIVLLYLFTVPPLASILGASASNNPYAALGASREMKSILSYELPFVISLLVPVIKAGSISLGSIVIFQQTSGAFAGSVSGILALLVALVCLQAKLGLAPFDYAEAETELAAGSQVEYSGPLLALWKLSRMALLVIGPLFLAVVFWGTGGGAALAGKYALFLAFSIVVRNTNPRLRIDQSVRFFWGMLLIAAALALTLAAAGL